MSADAAVLWSSDLFDRESPPSLESRYASLEEGLAGLWRHVLREGVQDDGRPTFTAFSLEVHGRAGVALPRDPFSNPELAVLRRRFFGGEQDLVDRLAALHAARLDEQFSFEPYLALEVLPRAPGRS